MAVAEVTRTGAGRRCVYPQGHAAGPRRSLSAILDPVEVCGVPAAELWGQISGVGSAISLGRGAGATPRLCQLTISVVSSNREDRMEEIWD